MRFAVFFAGSTFVVGLAAGAVVMIGYSVWKVGTMEEAI